MTDSKKYILFDQSGQCCSLQQMQQYIVGTLPRKEMMRVERHLADCPLCSDAVEGLSINNGAKVGDIVNEINRSISTRYIQRKRQGASIYSRVAAVAVITILISVGIYGYFNFRAGEEERIFAENFEKYPNKFRLDSVVQRLKDHNQAKPEVPENEIQPAPSSADNIKEPRDISEEKEVIAKQKITKNDEEIAAPAYSYSKDKINPAAPVPEAVEMEAKQEKMEISSQNNTVTKTSSADMAIGKDALNINADTVMANAMHYYRQSKYPQAIALFDLVIDQVENQKEAILYRGISYLEENDLKKAVKDFNYLIKSNDPEYLEVAMWYKSLALVRQKKNKEARELLQWVVDMNGAYKEKAQNVLKELN